MNDPVKSAVQVPVPEKPLPAPTVAPILPPIHTAKEQPAIIKTQKTTIVPPSQRISVPTMHAIHPGIAAAIKTAQTILAAPRGPRPIVAPTVPPVTSTGILKLKPAKRPNSTIPVMGVVVNPNTVTATPAVYAQTKATPVPQNAPKAELLPQAAPEVLGTPIAPKLTQTTKKALIPGEDDQD